MAGYKYSIAVFQLDNYGVIHPDAHMLFMKMQEEQPDIITAIMTQLSLKSGLKEWGNKSHNAVQFVMKQLNFTEMYKTMNLEITSLH